MYPRNGFAAHLIGYVGEVSDDMLNDPRYAYYEPGDVVGKSGVEQTYDQLLRGQDGSQDLIVDSHGRQVGVLGREPAVPGQRSEVDHRSRHSARGRSRPLATATARSWPWIRIQGRFSPWFRGPVFDPNDFAVRVSRDEWNRLITDQNHPLMNKAIQAQLAPGSTFKIIMSVAGLQEGVAQNMHVDCQGGATFYGHFFACDAAAWNGDHRERDSQVVRHVLLHAGAETGHRDDCQVRP